MEKEPSISQEVDAMCERFDAGFYALMHKIIEDIYKQDGDIINS